MKKLYICTVLSGAFIFSDDISASVPLKPDGSDETRSPYVTMETSRPNKDAEETVKEEPGSRQKVGNEEWLPPSYRKALHSMLLKQLDGTAASDPESVRRKLTQAYERDTAETSGPGQLLLNSILTGYSIRSSDNLQDLSGKIRQLTCLLPGLPPELQAPVQDRLTELETAKAGLEELRKKKANLS